LNPAPVTVITGASSGIGEGVAKLLASRYGARIVLVARREERLAALAQELGEGASFVAADVTGDSAPQQVLDHVNERHGRLDILINNAGASWRGTFADEGYANVRRTMDLNFDATVRMTEALLPLLRESAPSSIVNVASTAGRVARPGAGAYSASKFALAGWTDSLYSEEKAHGVHAGLVLPGFIETEGFPATELKAKFATRWLVSDVETAAAAIADVAVNGKAERYVPRGYALAAVARIVMPGLVRRILSGGAASSLTTATGADAADAGERSN
jgi:short-subunit dehydrogenase